MTSFSDMLEKKIKKMNKRDTYFKCPTCARWSIGNKCVPCENNIGVD